MVSQENLPASGAHCLREQLPFRSSGSPQSQREQSRRWYSVTAQGELPGRTQTGDEGPRPVAAEEPKAEACLGILATEPPVAP